MEYVDKWDGPVTDGNRFWSDLEDFEESWMLECDTRPEELICMEKVLPTWQASRVLERLSDLLDTNYSNEEGQYWSDFLDAEKVKELEPKFQALIDEFIAASSWRTWKETNKRIRTAWEDTE